MPQFFVDSTKLDYLTVTTFDRDTFQQVINSVTYPKQRNKDAEAMRIRGYEGQVLKFENGTLFWGFGLQQNTHHHMVIASGGIADTFGFALSELVGLGQYNVSRIDIQHTIKLPEWYSARSCVDALRGGQFKGRQRNVTMIDNYGNDTVYIGSRASDSFTRLYVKDSVWLRLEYEYKRDYATDAWSKVRNHGDKAKQGILYGELLKLPECPIVNLFKEHIRTDDPSAPKSEKVISTPNTTYLWLKRQVEPAVIRMLNSHESREATIDLLRSWIESGKPE